MTTALAHRFTRSEYHRMAETGVLAPDARVELLDGQIIDMLPIGPLHSSNVDWLNQFFVSRAAGRWITRVQSSIELNNHYEPQPDLALLRPVADFYRVRLPGPADIFLLIEVADSSLLVDRHDKIPAYAEAGIPEVWLVDVPRRAIEIHRQPAGRVYESIEVVSRGKQIAPQAFPDAILETEQVLF